MPHAAKRISQRVKARRPVKELSRAKRQSMYQSRAWKQLRVQHLSEHPYCVECIKAGKPLGRCMGNVVDHITPHKGDREKFLDPANLQTLCAQHHSRKTASEDGGFGNPTSQIRS